MAEALNGEGGPPQERLVPGVAVERRNLPCLRAWPRNRIQTIMERNGLPLGACSTTSSASTDGGSWPA